MVKVYTVINIDIINELLSLNSDGFAVIQRRYDLLRSISYTQPIGRRQLAIYTGCTEREVRADSDALRVAGYIRVENAGMILTRNGFKLLQDLEIIMHNFDGNKELVQKLKDEYEINNVDIVNGDVDSRVLVKRNLGLRAAIRLRSYMTSGYKSIALSGHDYVGMMVDGQYPENIGKGIVLYPARTAQINTEDINANTFCSRLGRKCGAGYKLLHLGDAPTIAEIEKRYNDPDVAHITSAVRSADMLISGITSLKRSHLLNSMSVRARDAIMQSSPCCELMGNFIKSDGKQVNNPPLYSLNFEHISKFKTFLLIAAGRDEVDGIRALLLRFKNIHLITDSTTANHLIMHN